MPTDKPLVTAGVVEVSISGSLAVVRWSRPEKRNSFNSAMANQLAATLESLAQNDDLSAVVLCAEGSIFCAGWDLDEINGVETHEQGSALIASGRRCLTAMDRMPQVIVSAVEGSTLGFGVALVAHCDVNLVAESARILLPELRHGIVPASVLGDLVVKVGRAKALRWCVMGEVPTNEALSSGLVSELIEKEQFESVVSERLESICRQAPAAIRATKQLSATLRGDQSDVLAKGDSFASSMIASRLAP